MRIGYFVLIAAIAFAQQATAQQTVGLFQEDSSTEQGYVLFGPMNGTSTHLIDKCGKSIHSWSSAYTAGASCYLLPDGSMLRPGSIGNATFPTGAAGGIIERQSWNGTMEWRYVLSNNLECQHHDVCPLPNGNVLALVWELHSRADAAANGRDTAVTGPVLWSEKVVELQPSGANGATVVWEWRAWDHLVQDADAGRPNYGPVAGHPELINLNYTGHGQLKAAPWLHLNDVAYNARLDQVMVSSYNFGELWIIDHSTTTAEAAAHTGGKHLRGGDLLYRWGNPAAYKTGTAADQVLYSPHDAQWIPDGYPGSGNITIYNNGEDRPQGNYSTAEEITPPVDSAGDYALTPAMPYGPARSTWRYIAPNPTDFFSPTLSSVQRLPGGHTLIAAGVPGDCFEVDSAGKMIWHYINPVTRNGPVAQGSDPGTNTIFRATQYSAGYAGLAGRTLTPGPPLEVSPIPYSCFLPGKIAVPAGVHTTSTITAEVVNPVAGNELRLRPADDAQGVRLVLLNSLGQRCASWTADLHQGIWTSLPLPGNVTSGHYTLHITAPNGMRRSMAVVRQ